jgi:peptide/nickel transport system substrate-binding protein
MHYKTTTSAIALAAALIASPVLAQPAQDLVVAVPTASIANLDPLGPSGLVQGVMQVNAQLFDTLVKFEDGEYVPSLATEWEASADAKAWTFTLRDGVSFSDGTALDAEDVKASLERVVTLAGPMAGLFRPITAEVVSPTELRLTSELGQGALLGKLSMLAIVPAEKLADETFGVSPVGSGPFKLESFDPSQGIQLSANADYWDGAPELSTVTFRMIPEPAARVTALETGEVHLTWTLSDDQAAALEGNPDVTLDSVTTLANILFWFNSGREAFADVAVRRALREALDIPTIIEALYPNTGAPMKGPLPDAVFGASEQTPFEFKPEEAKAALEAAGWDFNQTVRVLMTNSNYAPLVEAMIADWARIGVNVEIDLQEPAVGTRRLLDLDWDIAIIQPVITSTGDADYNLGRLYTCAANRTGYCDETLDQLLAKASASPDQAERAALYTEAGKIVWDNVVGMYPMNVRQVWGWSSRLEGVKLDPVYKPDLTEVRFAN